MHGDKQDLKEIPKIQHASRPLDATFNLWKSHHTCAQRISALPTTLVARFFGYHDPKDQRKVKQTGIWSNQEVSLSLSLSLCHRPTKSNNRPGLSFPIEKTHADTHVDKYTNLTLINIHVHTVCALFTKSEMTRTGILSLICPNIFPLESHESPRL